MRLAAESGAPTAAVVRPEALEIDVDDYSKIREDADKWANEQIKQMPNAAAPGA